jgi:hypothetical protein
MDDHGMDRSAHPTFGWPNVFSPEDSGMLIEDIYPSLYIGADRVEEMRRKADNLGWAARAVRKWKEEAEVVLGEEPRFVRAPSGGRLGMCRTARGQHVIFNPGNREEMWDPRLCRRVPATELMRKGWVTLCHERIRRLMSSLGFLYRLTGDQRYSRWVWKGLNALIGLYDDVAEEDETGNGIVYGGLYEAQCMLQIVQALELVERAPGSDSSDRRAVEERVLVRVGAKLSEWMSVMMVHNMSCWGMAALGVMGRHLDREDWVEKALYYRQCGLQKLLRGGLPRDEGTGEPDGYWIETAPFYSFFYALTSLIPLYRIGEDEGAIDDDLRERFHSFFEAPLNLVDSNLDFISISDRVGPGRLSLTQLRHIYEYAAGQLDSERWGPVLALLYESCGAPRASLAALGWGPDGLPEPGGRPRKSVALDRTRMVTFRARTDRGPATFWFYGGGNGPFEGHHHHDKLSLSLHAHGRIITSDLGLPSGQVRDTYDSFLTGTLAHNTLIVNEFDQGHVRSVRWERDLESEVPRASAAVRGEDGKTELFERLNQRVNIDAYEGVELQRTVFFDYPIIAVIDRCESPEERRFGIVFHSCGEMVPRVSYADEADPLDLEPLPKDGYWSLFEGRESRSPLATIRVDWRLTNHLRLRLITTADRPVEATFGRTPANPSDEHRGTVLARCRGTQCCYATVLEVHPGTPRVREVRLEEDGCLVAVCYDAEPLRYTP